MATRIPKCSRCRNHGLVVALKGHSSSCAFRQCVCWKCSLITERTRILESQRQYEKLESPDDESPKKAADANVTSSNTNGDDTKLQKNKNPVKRHSDGHVVQSAPKTSRRPEVDSDEQPGTSAPKAHEEGKFPVIVPALYSTEAVSLPIYPQYQDRHVLAVGPGFIGQAYGFLPRPPGALPPLLNWEMIHATHHYPYLYPYPELRREHGLIQTHSVEEPFVVPPPPAYMSERSNYGKTTEKH